MSRPFLLSRASVDFRAALRAARFIPGVRPVTAAEPEPEQGPRRPGPPEPPEVASPPHPGPERRGQGQAEPPEPVPGPPGPAVGPRRDRRLVPAHSAAGRSAAIGWAGRAWSRPWWCPRRSCLPALPRPDAVGNRAKARWPCWCCKVHGGWRPYRTNRTSWRAPDTPRDGGTGGISPCHGIRIP